MHQFFKNFVFIAMISVACIAVPFGISKFVAHNFMFGGIIIGAAGLILALFIKISAYYHNRKIDVKLAGFLGGLLIFIGGNYAMINLGLTDPVVLLKSLIISVAIMLHALVGTKRAFYFQKVALAVAIISVAFFQSLLLLAIAAAIVVMLFIISILQHANYAEKRD